MSGNPHTSTAHACASCLRRSRVLASIGARLEIRSRLRGRLLELLAMDDVPTTPSGEIVAPLIDCFLTGTRRELPVNLPNTGQCPDFPPDVVVESIGVADRDGIRGRDRAVAPPLLAEYLRRVSAAQELTVDAALSGSREKAFEAMLADPLAGRADFEQLAMMTDELIDATRPWLPQFA